MDISKAFLNKKKPNEVLFPIKIINNEYPFWVSECGITYPDPRYHEIRLNSDVSCIEYIISGSGTINIDGKTYIVHPGDTYLLPSGQSQNYYSDFKNPMEKIWFNFKGSLGDNLLKIYHLNNKIIFKNTNSRPLIEEMIEICSSDKSPEEIQDAASKHFLNIIVFLYRTYKENTPAELSHIEYIQSYINNHLSDDLSIETLAKIANLNNDYLIRVFKKKYGLTPYQYILNEKLKIARALLTSTKKSSREIAEELKLGDEHNFTKLFKNKLGVTPSAFRKNPFYD